METNQIPQFDKATYDSVINWCHFKVKPRGFVAVFGFHMGTILRYGNPTEVLDIRSTMKKKYFRT